MNTVFERKSHYSVDETLSKVKSALAEHSFGVLWEINFRNKFSQHNYDYEYDFWILEVCNPQIAYGVIQANQNAGYFLPCKIAVFDSKDGVKAGLVNPAELISLIDTNPTIIEKANKVLEILTTAINEALEN